MTKQWNKLPVGTRIRVTNPSGSIFDGGARWSREDQRSPESGDRAEAYGWSVHPDEFADSNKRISLAALGFFSADDPGLKRQREAARAEEARRVDAYASLGLNRDRILGRIVARMEGQLDNGVWATSSIDFAKRREALDNAILFAAGVTTHA